ncbi:PREDICTED: uncharacterized protein LOC105623552 [Atta cephalotes]|uniref:Uncharacterized protein n=1 Tax=Atta cephalotes TaxID=12957 RepID=A0A158NS26_ATTCE|nr:PREDICTED: uncharacterized protein LOC105623552 [Atta cephalotes]
MEHIIYQNFYKTDFEWAVKLNRLSLELIGLWPRFEQTTWEKPVAPIIQLIANDWTKTTTSQEKAMMIAKAQIARIIITFGYGMMAAAITVMAVLPIFGYSVRHLSNITADLERPLPIQTYYIYDTTRSPQYEMTYAVQSIASLLCIMCYTGIDSFLSLSVFHISGQLDILRNRLLHLHAVANFNNVLKNCIMEHIRLLRYILS